MTQIKYLERVSLFLGSNFDHSFQNLGCVLKEGRAAVSRVSEQGGGGHQGAATQHTCQQTT